MTAVCKLRKKKNSMASFFGCDITESAGGGNDVIDSNNALDIFKIITPKHSPYPLIRVGGSRDGSYLVPNDLAGIGYCLSPGVNNFKHFEDELSSKFDITCDMYDASSDVDKLSTPLIVGKQTFDKKWLDIDGKPNSISIGQWLEEKSSQDDRDCLLQIDIEGAEYRNLLHTDSQDLARFRIIVIELHKLAVGFTRPKVFNRVIKPFLEKIDEQFICVHSHPNNVLGTYMPPSLNIDVPRILELTFLRKDRFAEAKNYQYASVPHPLDITNVPERPPLHLSSAWMNGPRSVESRTRIAKDWLNYCKYRIARKTKSLATNWS